MSKDFPKSACIPLHVPHMTGNETSYVSLAIAEGSLSGDGPYTSKCHEWMRTVLHARKVFLTTSCTTAIEMATLLARIEPGDEVIVPSFTFSSTINPFVLRGAHPVFVDIREDTLNMHEALVREAVSSRTKAIVPVHYAGVACELDPIMALASEKGLFVIEDAACGFGATYRGRSLGTIGDAGCFSFHKTKCITCGEGGAILLNREEWVERAEIIRDKGTDRGKFLRGEVREYTWRDMGSSMLPSDMLAAFLYAQLEGMEDGLQRKKALFQTYCHRLGGLARDGALSLPHVPEHCETNYDTFYILLPDGATRNGLMKTLNQQGVGATFHYLPLHQSPMGVGFGYRKGDLPVTEEISERILRLPLYVDLSSEDQGRIIRLIREFFEQRRPA